VRLGRRVPSCDRNLHKTPGHRTQDAGWLSRDAVPRVRPMSGAGTTTSALPERSPERASRSSRAAGDPRSPGALPVVRHGGPGRRSSPSQSSARSRTAASAPRAGDCGPRPAERAPPHDLPHGQRPGGARRAPARWRPAFRPRRSPGPDRAALAAAADVAGGGVARGGRPGRRLRTRSATALSPLIPGRPVEPPGADRLRTGSVTPCPGPIHRCSASPRVRSWAQRAARQRCPASDPGLPGGASRRRPPAHRERDALSRPLSTAARLGACPRNAEFGKV